MTKTLITLISVVLLLMAGAFGQVAVTGTITTNASTCATSGVCVALANLTTGSASSGGVTISLSGTWTGTVSFEATTDGTNWVAINGLPLNSSTAASSATSGGVWQFNAAGLTQIRGRGSATMTGTVTVVIQASTASARSGGGGGGSGTTIASTTNVIKGDNTGNGIDAGFAASAVGLNTSPLSQFAATTSAQLAGVLSDETGSGVAVFGTAPTLSNPVVGTQTALDGSTKAASTKYADDAATAAALAAGGPSVMSITDNFCGGTNSTGNIGEKGWGFSTIGSAPTMTSAAGTYPNMCQAKFLTAVGATQGQGGGFGLSASGGTTGWMDFSANTNWAVTYIFQLGSATSDVLYIGLGSTPTSLRQVNGITLRHDTTTTLSGAAITSVICTTTVCTVTLTSGNGMLVGQSITISGETCPTRNVNVANSSTYVSGSVYKFAASGAAETCTVQGTATSAAETTFKYVTAITNTTTQTVTDSTITADTGWHKITIASTVAGTAVFTLDSNSPVSISTNLPSTALLPVVIIGTDTTAQKFVLLNYFRFLATGLAR